jgi:hypothetical protein
LPYRPRPSRRSLRGAHARGYTREHQRLTAEAIQREPWCHNPDCPHDDAGTPANPLQGHHPHSLGQGGAYDQPVRIPMCRRCNIAIG